MLGIPTCTIDGPLRPGAGAWVQRPFGPLYHCRHGSASVQLYQSYALRRPTRTPLVFGHSYERMSDEALTFEG